ncbi:anthranilate phosphoribosyltransferase [Monosporozyma unispora]|nr:anthranilate phosphoribosyltransferase [Kazachstania unispora]
MDTVVRNTKKLLASPPTLTPTDLYETINIIIPILDNDNNSTQSQDNIVKIASFLSCLRTSGLDHKAEYIAQAARAVLNYSDLVPSPCNDNSNIVVMDIVGTGGDGQNTFNVSTSSAIVASGIPGIKIVKHGGKASTSNSGAGDLISTLGCDVSKVNAVTVPQLWNDNSFLFLLAPYFHSGMKSVALIRKQLGIPTIFNVLGPLLHPVASSVNKRVLGVYSKDLALEYAKAASLVYPNTETFVVWGHVGLDEVSPIGKTTIWYVNKESAIEQFDIEPSLFGLIEHPLNDCLSLGPQNNARILKEEILSGKFKLGDNHPIYDYILLNTSVLYCLSQGIRDWKLGVLKAEESIQSGQALKSLLNFINNVKSLNDNDLIEKVPLKKIN